MYQRTRFVLNLERAPSGPMITANVGQRRHNLPLSPNLWSVLLVEIFRRRLGKKKNSCMAVKLHFFYCQNLQLYGHTDVTQAEKNDKA